MKKILIIIRALTHGGAEKSLVSFLNTLDEKFLQDNEIIVDLLLTQRKQFFEYQLPEYVNIIECPFDYAAYCNSLKSLMSEHKISFSVFLRKVYSAIVKKILGKHSCLALGELQWKYIGQTLKKFPKEYDVAMAYFHDASTYYLIDKVKAKKKIIWIHNEYEKLGYNDDFERKYYFQADKIVTISDRCVDSLVKHFPELQDKVEMIENISSRKLIHNMANVDLPKEYNENQINILSVGRLCDQKGYDLGIEAINYMKNLKGKIHWFIIGAGEKELELKSIVRKYGLEDTISFIGLRSNPYPYIKNCDIFFQPSRFEGKSIALDEAKILERPILVTSYDTAQDSIANGINGLICGMSPIEISKSLSMLVENKSLREKLIRELKDERCGNEKEIEKYITLFE